MPLESVTYISDLVATNPVGATDPKSQGDDHIRNIKSALLTTFPSITGAVTPTHTQINQLASLAAVSVLGRSANSAGAPAAIAAGANDRILRRVSDAIDFGQLTAGMFPNTVVPDAALSSNVPLLDASTNLFTGTDLILSGSTAARLGLYDGGAGTNQKRWELNNDDSVFSILSRLDDGTFAAQPFSMAKDTSGFVTIAQLTATTVQLNGLLDFNGAADFNQAPIFNSLNATNVASSFFNSAHANGPFVTFTNALTPIGYIGEGPSIFSGGVAGELSLTSAGATSMGFGVAGTKLLTLATSGITTPNTVAGEVGYKGTPQNAQNGDYTLVLTDAAKTIYKASGGAGETITIPANASVAFPVGTVVRVVNNGGGALSIAITSDTLSWAGAGTTGTRTLADHGVAVLEKVASTEWFISGVGLS